VSWQYRKLRKNVKVLRECAKAVRTIGRISGLPVNGRPVLRPSADWASVDARSVKRRFTQGESLLAASVKVISLPDILSV